MYLTIVSVIGHHYAIRSQSEYSKRDAACFMVVLE